MRKSWVRIGGMVAGAALILAGCTAADSAVFAMGRVDSSEVIVTAPALVAPEFTPASEQSAGPGPGLLVPARAQAVRVTAVEVTLGQTVVAGQVLVRLDATMLAAQVGVAIAGRAAAAAQVHLLTSTITDLKTDRTTATEARRRIDSAITTLTENRRQAAGQLAAARAQLAALPQAPPPEQAAHVQQARLRLQAAITQLRTAIGRLDAGLAQARSQRSRLAEAETRLTDAIEQVNDLLDLSRIAVTVADISVKLAQAQQSEATVTAPAAGVVTSLPGRGAAVAPGATLVTIGTPALRASTWLAPAQAARICPRDAARITADWLPDSRSGTVTMIAPRAEYPPTHQSTGETHLTRAIRVQIAVTGPGLVAGAPLDVHVTPCGTS